MNILLIFPLLILSISGANILITYETARRSHQIWIGELAQRLAETGHNITVAGPFSRVIPESENYHPITFEGTFLTHYKFNRSEHLTSSPLKRLYLNHKYNYAICNRTYNSKGFNNLWNYPHNFTFDLILLDLTFGHCLYPLIQRFGRSYSIIGYSPSALTPFLAEIFDNGFWQPSSNFVSPILEPISNESFLVDKLWNYLFTKIEIIFKKTYDKWSIEQLARNLLNKTFSFDELEKSISFLFINQHFSLINAPQALTPNIIPVGGMHIRKLEELPGILNLIIGNANQGIIFFSTGTDIQQNIFSSETKLNFAKAFSRLVQKTVIWKDNIDDDEHPFKDQPSNILIHKWSPQHEILAHLHTKLLITTGGTLSIQEAIYHGVPVIGIPIYDEQHRNIQFIVENKLGIKLDYNNLTESTIYEAINTVLQNPMKFRDQSENPLKKALYWVEYVLRHNSTKGAQFLNPRSRNNNSGLLVSEFEKMKMRFSEKFRRKISAMFHFILLSIFSINQSNAARRTFTNGTWIRMGLIFDEMMQNDQSPPSCKLLPGLSPGQTKLCQLYIDHMNAVAFGAKQSLNECKYQFHNRRWNCTILDDVNVFGPMITIASRETAFAHALSSAGVSYSVSRACRDGQLSSCGCSRMDRPKDLKKDWVWGGCGDNLEYGYKFTQNFIDVRERERKFKRGTREQGKTLMNLHNNEAGRRAVINKSKVTCKCHGVSGTCTLITCWQQLATFREIGDYLRDKYDGATEVRVNRRGRLQIKDPTITIPTAYDLVYLEESPDYCNKNDLTGSLGTHGRPCNRSSFDVDGCNILCCGRGYNTIKLVIKERCKCKFKWCCEVQCQTCVKSMDTHTCK